MKYILTAIAALSATVAFGHPGGHDDERPVVQTPEQVARGHVVRLVTQSKLAASWSKALAKAPVSRTVKGAQQTVVTFTNAAEPAARRVLHVVTDSSGQLVSATPTAR